jgi:hypothetical protein
LVGHYAVLVNSGERPLVIRKLATTLATIFLKPGAPWTRAIWNVAASLSGSKYVPENQARSVDLLNSILPAMSQAQIVALLYFCNVLGEDINKWSPEFREGVDIRRAAENIQDAFLVVEFVLHHFLMQDASQDSYDPAPGIEALNAYSVSSPWTCILHYLSAWLFDTYVLVMDVRARWKLVSRHGFGLPANVSHKPCRPMSKSSWVVENCSSGCCRNDGLEG